MFWFLADNTDDSFSADDDTFFTDFFDGRTDFHERKD